ncbi:hypothetical protein ACUOFC_32230, partial [Escherichia sp. TWPC-MK]
NKRSHFYSCLCDRGRNSLFTSITDSAQLLQEIDWKMSRIESILQQVSVDGLIEEAYEIHEMLLKVSQLLLILQQDLKMTPLAKGLSLQLQSIQEQYNRLFSKGEISRNLSE